MNRSVLRHGDHDRMVLCQGPTSTPFVANWIADVWSSRFTRASLVRAAPPGCLRCPDSPTLRVSQICPIFSKAFHQLTPLYDPRT